MAAVVMVVVMVVVVVGDLVALEAAAVRPADQPQLQRPQGHHQGQQEQRDPRS